VFRLLGGTVGPAVAGAIMGTYETSIVYPIVINGQISYIPVMIPSDFSFSLNYLIAMGIAIMMSALSLTSKNIQLGQRATKEAIKE